MYWILDWTGGHPYLTQRLCAALAASPTRDSDATAVDKVVEKTFLGEQSAQDSNLQFVRDMLTKRAPDKTAVLRTYRRIHSGRTVPDEERSLVKTHLKLSGVVKAENSYLRTGNRIYRHVFNIDWIRANTLIDWPRLVAIPSTVVAILLVGFFIIYFGFSPPQSSDARAQVFLDTFRDTTSVDVRVTSLAGLFQVPGYRDQAIALFFEELTLEEQVALFEEADAQAVGKQLIVVTQGLYTYLDDSPAGNRLLTAMSQTAREICDKNESVETTNLPANLPIEIERWLAGRDYASQEKFNYAVEAYNIAIALNPDNIGTRFDRALAYIELERYEDALVDLDTMFTVSEKVGQALPTLTVTPSLKPTSRTRTPTSTISPTFSPTADDLTPTLSKVTRAPSPTAPSPPVFSTVFISPISPISPIPTPTFTPTATPIPTPTSEPTFTPTPIPTLVPMLTPTPQISVKTSVFCS